MFFFDGVDEVAPPPGDVPPGEVVLEFPLLLLPHAASSTAMTATTAVIATPYLRRNTLTSPVCPDPAGRIVHSRRSLNCENTVVVLGRTVAPGTGVVTRSLHLAFRMLRGRANSVNS